MMLRVLTITVTLAFIVVLGIANGEASNARDRVRIFKEKLAGKFRDKSGVSKNKGSNAPFRALHPELLAPLDSPEIVDAVVELADFKDYEKLEYYSDNPIIHWPLRYAIQASNDETRKRIYKHIKGNYSPTAKRIASCMMMTSVKDSVPLDVLKCMHVIMDPVVVMRIIMAARLYPSDQGKRELQVLAGNEDAHGLLRGEAMYALAFQSGFETQASEMLASTDAFIRLTAYRIVKEQNIKALGEKCLAAAFDSTRTWLERRNALLAAEKVLGFEHVAKLANEAACPIMNSYYRDVESRRSSDLGKLRYGQRNLIIADLSVDKPVTNRDSLHWYSDPSFGLSLLERQQIVRNSLELALRGLNNGREFLVAADMGDGVMKSWPAGGYTKVAGDAVDRVGRAVGREVGKGVEDFKMWMDLICPCVPGHLPASIDDVPDTVVIITNSVLACRYSKASQWLLLDDLYQTLWRLGIVVHTYAIFSEDALEQKGDPFEGLVDCDISDMSGVTGGEMFLMTPRGRRDWPERWKADWNFGRIGSYENPGNVWTGR